MDESSILDLAGLATPMAIRVAATLGLVERTGTAEHLASETGTAVGPLACLLDHLVSVGVFTVDAETGHYRPTSLGAQIREVGPLLDINAAGGRAELAFVELLGTITTGRPAYAERYGRDFWSDVEADPELRRSFDHLMTWRIEREAPQVAERFDWSRFQDIVDVGGGDGTILEAILRANSQARGRVLDLAPATAAATARFADAGLGDRAGTVTGSFFDPLPAGSDAYLLSDILHDWDDDHAREILTACRRAAAPNGIVVVIELVRERGADTATDLFMLMCYGGRERTIGELAALGAECGLVVGGSRQVSDERTAVEFRVAPGAG
ncbi:methyltransferase [Amycolatopsis coloradensis]|uniref:Methyltransferase n=1 Tax=Amycolatopsis coloradensis TaxID=76021 RepID=A0A1R0KJD6_9PSEU|nr:methyltransferase [Amycolatopsis coloradensis]OLZ46150.1 methyltransferase [Amycolatopsis coloradensis]